MLLSYSHCITEIKKCKYFVIKSEKMSYEKKRIKFDESKFKVNAYIKETIELCEMYGGTLEIDRDFCVYAIYDGTKHWVGHARPYDMDWFDAQFTQ